MTEFANGQPPEPETIGEAPETETAIVDPDDHDIRRVFTTEYRGEYAYLWGQWHNYNPEHGIWEEAERKIRRTLETFMTSGKFQKLRINTSRVESVLKMAANHLPEDDDLPEYPYLIPLQNGVFDVRKQEFTEHSPAYYFKKCMPYDYDPQATWETWFKFLTQVIVNPDGSPDWATIEFLQEATGYALYGDNRMQIAVFLWGDGGSGKSTYIETLQKLVNSEAAIDLQSMSQNEMAMLVGERLAVFNELDKNAMIPEAAFKRALSSDRVVAKLLYKDPFTFRPAFSLWGAMNHLPRVKDRSRAVFRRVHVVRFPIRVEKPDTTLPQKLENELGGIFVWAMEGLKRLLDRGHFQPSPAIQAANNAWQYQQDTEKQFLDSDEIILGDKYMAQASHFYTAYKQWCLNNGHRPKTSTTVAEDWRRLGLYRRKRNGGRHYWMGAGLVADYPDVPNDITEKQSEQLDMNLGASSYEY